MEVGYRIIALLMGYAFGNISPGLILAKIHNVDLRNSGSGNVGSTNVARTLGFKGGLLTLLCDCLKAVIPGLIIIFALSKMGVEYPRFYATYAAFGAVMGHIFPIALGFKGGKGIATSLGFIFIGAPLAVLGCIVGFFASVLSTRYVSLGSMVCAIILPIEVGLMAYFGLIPYGEYLPWEVFALFLIDAVICAIKHRDNIRRLIAGTESKFVIKK